MWRQATGRGAEGRIECRLLPRKCHPPERDGSRCGGEVAINLLAARARQARQVSLATIHPCACEQQESNVSPPEPRQSCVLSPATSCSCRRPSALAANQCVADACSGRSGGFCGGIRATRWLFQSSDAADGCRRLETLGNAASQLPTAACGLPLAGHGRKPTRLAPSAEFSPACSCAVHLRGLNGLNGSGRSQTK